MTIAMATSWSGAFADGPRFFDIGLLSPQFPIARGWPGGRGDRELEPGRRKACASALTEGGSMPDCGIDWEDAFANAAYIPGGDSFPQAWSHRAAAFRDSAHGELGVAYGAHERECFDLFYPATEPKGLAVFVHGGYWLAFDRSFWSDLANGARELGWAVALPSYGLAPEFRIGQITSQIRAAIALAAERVSGPIRLAGHSAGGHLVSRMICDDVPSQFAARIEKVVSISGLHDLRPLQSHSMNRTLRLDPSEASAESPALHDPVAGAAFVAWAGANERPEFLRQSALIVEAWRLRGTKARLVIEEGRTHFDVIDGLKDARHPLAQAFAGD